MRILSFETLKLLRNPEIRKGIHEVLDANPMQITREIAISPDSKKKMIILIMHSPLENA